MKNKSNNKSNKIGEKLLAFGIRAGLSLALAALLAFLGVVLVCGAFMLEAWIISGLVIFGIALLSIILSDLFSLAPPALNKVLTTIYSFVLVVGIFSLLLYAMISSEFNFADMNWAKIFTTFAQDERFYLTLSIMFGVFICVYYGFANREEIIELFTSLTGRKGKLNEVEANLENSRWMTDAERDKIFTSCKYSELATMKKDGVPIRALYDGKNDMKITFNSPCHGLIIGSTGSGKTTTFINPMIQLLGASGAGSSMIS